MTEGDKFWRAFIPRVSGMNIFKDLKDSSDSPNGALLWVSEGQAQSKNYKLKIKTKFHPKPHSTTKLFKNPFKKFLHKTSKSRPEVKILKQQIVLGFWHVNKKYSSL